MLNTETDRKPDVHPKVVARAFKVHLRTVFRWVKKGHLISRNGRIDRAQVLEALGIWKLTHSIPEARQKLRIRPATLSNWNKKGILDSAEVLGARRFYKLSIQRILNLPNYRAGTKRVLFNASLQETFETIQDEAIAENIQRADRKFWAKVDESVELDNTRFWEEEKARRGLTYEKRPRPTSHLPESTYSHPGFTR